MKEKKKNTTLNVLDELPVSLVSYCSINIQPILKVHRTFTAQKMKKSFMQKNFVQWSMWRAELNVSALHVRLI